MSKTLFLILRFCFLPLLFSALHVNAQDAPRHTREFSISTANDAFLIIGDDIDRFYSFGFGASLKFRDANIVGLETLFPHKADFFYEIGFRIEGYTPTDKEVLDIEIQTNTVSFDRPFAGITYGVFNVAYAFERSNLKTGVLLGFIGDNSQAGDIQAWVHENITNDEVFKEEWKFQVPNQLLFNLNIAYAYDFLPRSKWVDIFGTADAQVGNLFINATPKMGLRLGKFKSISKSIGFDNTILSDNTGFELFLQSTISGTVNIFDATAQGNIFNNDFKYAVTDLNTFHSTITHSIYGAYGRFSLGYEQYFTTGKTLRNAQHSYARLVLRYKF